MAYIAVSFNLSSGYHLWLEVGLGMLSIFIVTLLIPLLFNKPIWPHLYKSTLRLLGSASFFIYLFFFKYPSVKETAFIICAYYFLYIFTELFIGVQSKKQL